MELPNGTRFSVGTGFSDAGSRVRARRRSAVSLPSATRNCPKGVCRGFPELRRRPHRRRPRLPRSTSDGDCFMEEDGVH